MSLKTRTLHGFFWSLTQQFGVQITMILVTVFLARILEPADFGLIGMLAVFMALGNSLIDAGMTSSLIRTKDADQRDYSTVFFINLAVGLLVYLAMFLSAGLISQFFNQPALESIIKVYCLTFLIYPFSAVQRTRLVKKMDFKTEMKVTIPSTIVGGIFGLVLAIQGFGVWALVGMNLAQNLLLSIQFWIYSKWRPSWVVDWERFKYHFGFGAKLTIAGVINSVFSNIYHLVIGKFFPVTQLGYYAKADSLKQIPVKNISNTLSKVTFPMFSEIQDDNEKLKIAYKRIMQQVLFWLTPVMVFSIVLAEPLFRIVLTEKWLPAVPYFQILCFIGLMFPIHSYNLNILKVKGRSDLYLKLEIIKKSLTVLGIVVALPFGIFALLWTQVILNLVAFGINSFYSGRFIGYNVWRQIRDIFPIFLVGAIAGFACWLVKDLIQNVPFLDWIKLIAGGLMGVCIYFLISWGAKTEPFVDFRTIILKR
ncbi:lipopolysaccharide biosynthesis protein [Algoriphagus limi]|uniref:Lipopolysaccharide biosynthesis protein n=1 Tax=Algoriphagus limi TaxID=2975273 RepID=A0ABT2G114_9BACT|nr:lipopolysaccharide biosynthesis protein [Algoriphagus limi]MCS5488960.1 lipopolysaccharide biosynthesis protein [Algoriphagus limi]